MAPQADNPSFTGGLDRAAEELRESEARYRDLFENAHDIIYTLDLQGNITSLNKRAEATFGFSREECIGRNAAEMVPAEYMPRMLDALRSKLAGGPVPTVYELEMLRKDGSRVWLEVSSRLIVRDGKAAGIQGIARDIGERRRTEAVLRAVRSQLELVTDTMSAAVTHCSRDMRYLWASRRYGEWVGQPPAELAGKRIVDVIGSEGFAVIRPYIERVLTGAVVEFEAAVNYRESGTRWVHVIYTPTHDAGGQPDGWVAVVTDIGERRRVEQALREADRRKDEFLAMLAHELRNPLAPLRSSLEFLDLKMPRDAELRWACDLMERQVQLLTRLTDDLLDVSRITQGKVHLRKERVNLAAIVSRAVETSRPLIEGKKHTLTVAFPAEPLWLEADATRLAQVVSNLLNNAAKFTEAGGHITVAAEKADGFALVRVRDTGIGIPAELLPHIFDLFVQADRSLDRSQGGLGVGLTLVRRLVEMHGGSVSVSSGGAGQGSEFLIRVPVSPQASEASGTPSDRSTPAVTKRRVLLVEDNTSSAAAMARLLQAVGHEVQVSHDGVHALELSQKFKPEVVLLDIGLPGMNGFEVAQRLRQHANSHDLMLVALSGYSEESHRRRARESGFDHYLIKPVSIRDLQALFASRGR
jgi:PAS domain S-box-containing protein